MHKLINITFLYIIIKWYKSIFSGLLKNVFSGDAVLRLKVTHTSICKI